MKLKYKLFHYSCDVQKSHEVLSLQIEKKRVLLWNPIVKNSINVKDSDTRKVK